jgi:TolA-binding protein
MKDAMNSMKRSLIFLLPVFFLIGCTKPSAEELYLKGESAQKDGEYDKALETYQELMRTYPDSVRTPEAYYAVGTIYQNYKNDNRSALNAYRDLVAKYPHHPASSNAAFLVGFMYDNNFHRTDSARAAYDLFLKNYPSDPLNADARFELGNLGKDPAQILAEQQHSKGGKNRPGKNR